ncbi:MAG: ATP-binding protein [Candidatus Kerfeldbacteria bacterium]|nr:ATP-binding protein [Candidatus Kerfeldbacteria bacterium]
MEQVQNLFRQVTSGGIAALQGLIDSSIRESEILEYKTASRNFTDSDKKEIKKDISAMANSGGGVIIYGIATDPSDKTKPNQLESIDPLNIETIDRVIASGIQPNINGISKHIVESGTKKYLILYIPKSESAPHQNLQDFRYYRRIGTESKPMEHFVLELFFGKRLSPVLSLEVEPLNRSKELIISENGWSEEIDLRLFIRNRGKKIAKYVQLLIFFPPKNLIEIAQEQRLDNIDDLYAFLQARQYTNDLGVIHPETRQKITDIKIKINIDLLGKPEGNIVDWKISADEMQRKKGGIKVSSLVSLFPDGIKRITTNI